MGMLTLRRQGAAAAAWTATSGGLELALKVAKVGEAPPAAAGALALGGNDDSGLLAPTATASPAAAGARVWLLEVL